MWLWFGAFPLSWLLGLPFGGAFYLFTATPSIPQFAAMLVVFAGMAFAARRSLNY
jgi:hypothetical protein